MKIGISCEESRCKHKSLGVNLNRLREENVKKMKTDIKNKLDDYRKIGLSWLGKIAVIKMKILPKIIYLFTYVATNKTSQRGVKRLATYD